MKLILSSAFILTGLLSLPVMAQDNSELSKKLELAKQYSALIPVADSINQTINDLATQVPVDKRVLFQSVLERNLKADQLQSVSEMALADVFTVKELEALVAFYSSDEGKAIKDKMPVYQSRLEPVLGQMIRDAVEAYDRQAK